MNKQIEILTNRYPVLNGCTKDIESAFEYMKSSYEAGGKLLVAGNGGSAADSEHIVGELMKGFKKTRKLKDETREKLLNVNEELGIVLADNLQGALPAIALDGARDIIGSTKKNYDN